MCTAPLFLGTGLFDTGMSQCHHAPHPPCCKLTARGAPVCAACAECSATDGSVVPHTTHACSSGYDLCVLNALTEELQLMGVAIFYK